MNISLKSLYNWYRNTLRNPQYRWWVILGTLVYLVSPIDIAPDFIPVAGQIDDIAILTLLVSELSQMVLDYAKSRQSNVASSEAAEGTVDVDAVPLQ